MRDMRDIVEVVEVNSREKANELLQSDDWFLLDTAPGQDADRHPTFLYCLGRKYREPGPPEVLI